MRRLVFLITCLLLIGLPVFASSTTITYTTGGLTTVDLGCQPNAYCGQGSQWDHLVLEGLTNTLYLEPGVAQNAPLNLAYLDSGVNQCCISQFPGSVTRPLTVTTPVVGGVDVTNPFTIYISYTDHIIFDANGPTVNFALAGGQMLQVTPLGQNLWLQDGGAANHVTIMGRFEVVPEPAFLGFLAVGLTGLYVARRRRLA
jgi:hypothetical protein